MARRLFQYFWKSAILFSYESKPLTSLTLYSSNDKEQDFWRDPFTDQTFGGKSTIETSFIDVELDEKDFFKPNKQGIVDKKRGKQIIKSQKMSEILNEENNKEIEEESRYKTKVLQLKGILNHEIPKDQKQYSKITKLGFISIMSYPAIPVLDLSAFDAIEYRVRVMDNRNWIANIGCKGDRDGEIYQAVFTGEKNKWSSVIIPLNKYLFTQRGVIAEIQQDVNKSKISTMGFLQAERKSGEFCIQIESIRALSLEKLSKDIRYDPNSGNTEELLNADKDDNNFDIKDVSKKKSYYSKVFKY